MLFHATLTQNETGKKLRVLLKQLTGPLHYQHYTLTILIKNIVSETLGVVLKNWRDMRDVQLSLSELLEKAGVKSKMDTI